MNSENRWPRALLLLGVIAVSACGDGGTGPSAVAPPPAPVCTRSTLYQGPLGQVPAMVLLRAPLPPISAGRLDVTVDWTFPDSRVAVFLVAAGQCTLEQLNARSCDFLIRSESGAKPRRVSSGSLAAGNYDLLVGNGGSQDESMSAELVLSSPACPAVAAETPQATGNGPGEGVAFVGMLRR